jgi:hypothetical protein
MSKLETTDDVKQAIKNAVDNAFAEISARGYTMFAPYIVFRREAFFEIVKQDKSFNYIHALIADERCTARYFIVYAGEFLMFTHNHHSLRVCLRVIFESRFVGRTCEVLRGLLPPPPCYQDLDTETEELK